MSTWNSPPQIPPFNTPPFGAKPEQQMQATIAYLKQLANIVSAMKNDLEHMLNGNLDVNNIRAKGIKAHSLDVEELSAITANLGKILAGLIYGVAIYGSYIATAEGEYPRAEMSNTSNMFGAYGDANKYVKIEANLNNLNAPMTNYGFNGIETWLMQISSGFLIFGPNSNVSYNVNNLELGGTVQVDGGRSHLGFANVDLATDPDSAVVRLNQLIIYLRSMGILQNPTITL